MKCKVNDMAIIIKSTITANLMKIVEVKEYIGRFEKDEVFKYRDNELRAPDTGDYWWIETPVGGTPLETFLGETRRAYCLDAWLQPIRPDILDDDPEYAYGGLDQTHKVDA